MSQECVLYHPYNFLWRLEVTGIQDLAPRFSRECNILFSKPQFFSDKNPEYVELRVLKRSFVAFQRTQIIKNLPVSGQPHGNRTPGRMLMVNKKSTNV